MKASIKTPAEMADEMKISLSTMYKILKNDPSFPAKKFGGKWYIDENLLSTWITSKKKAHDQQFNLF